MEDAEQQKRRAKRVEVAIPSRIRHSDFRVGHVMIRDLSFWGFQAEAELELKEGEFVSVDLPNLGLVRARVAWSRGGKFAASFLAPVDVRKCVRKASAPA